MVSSRQKIIFYLEHHGSASATELATVLQKTPANIRHHVSILRSEGVITPIPNLTINPRGRPSVRYSLSSQCQAHNLERLCSILFDMLLINRDLNQRTNLLQEIAKRLVGEPIEPSTNLTQKLIKTTEILNSMAYKASWEAHPDSPIIKLAHCPYLSTIANHPELCIIDKYILEYLTGINAQLIEKRHEDSSGETFCKFRLSIPLNQSAP